MLAFINNVLDFLLVEIAPYLLFGTIGLIVLMIVCSSVFIVLSPLFGFVQGYRAEIPKK